MRENRRRSVVLPHTSGSAGHSLSKEKERRVQALAFSACLNAPVPAEVAWLEVFRVKKGGRRRNSFFLRL
jgi:hypothetical protein